MESPVPRPAQFRTAIAFGLATIGVVLTYWLRNVILLAFLSLILAVLLDAVAELGIRYLHMRRGVAVMSATVVFVVTVLATLALIVIPLTKQGTDFVQALPKKISNIERWTEHYRTEFPWLERYWPTEASSSSKVAAGAPGLAKKALVTASAALENLGTGLAVFFLGLFLAFHPERWLRGVAELWPGPGVEWRMALGRRIGAGLRSYLFMMGFYILIMGIAWAVGLWLIGIEYPLLFGAIGGLAEIVPYVGPMVGLIPPLILSLTGGTTKILAVLGLYAALHVIEGYVLVPFLMDRREHLPAPLVVLSVLVCSTLFGTLGVVLALPLATAAYVIASETIYASRRSSTEPPETTQRRLIVSNGR